MNRRETKKWCGVWKSSHGKSFEIEHLKDSNFQITIRNKHGEIFNINKHGGQEFLSVNLKGVLQPSTKTITVALGDPTAMGSTVELHLVKPVRRKRPLFYLGPFRAIFAVVKSGDLQDESDGGEKAFWAYPLLEYYKSR